jgi:hypothetical protein
MLKKGKSILFLFFLMSAVSTLAQDIDSFRIAKKKARKEKLNIQSRQMEEEGVIRYKKQWVAGFKLTGDGYGGFVEYGKYLSPRKSLLFQLDISERKHLKEEKLEPYEASMQPFVYGKLNFFYPVKLGVQYQYLVGNKGNTNGVNVTLNGGGGFALALLRPYEYETFEDSIYTYILGGPRLSDGWNNMKTIPGVFIKTGVRFDYGKFRDVIAGLEIGCSAEYYFKSIPQLAFIKERKDFSSIYVSLLMGRRK